MKIHLLLAVLTLGLVVFSAPRLAHAEDLKIEDAKAFITKQLDAIKAADVAAVKAGLSARKRDKVDAKMLDKAKGEVGKYTVDDLVHKLDGNKIKMKNGRTLTTMMKVDGKWVADSLWFK